MDAQSELQVRKKKHEESLASQVEHHLVIQVADLREAIAQGKACAAEVPAVLQREAAAIEAIRRAWLAMHDARRYVVRRGARLDEADRLLAGHWSKCHGEDRYWIEAMNSARCAELVALNIYREIYGEAEDLSILEETAPSDERWKTADIVAGGRWIDIKNACRSYSSRNSYSEHLVKRLKSNERNQPVLVSGFLSHYENAGLGTGRDVVWLGETTRDTIEGLKRQFETDYMRLELCIAGENRIPPWLFDYPPECYAERDAALACMRSHSFVLPRAHCPLSLLVVTGRVEPSSSENPLSQEIVAFSRRIAAGGTLTRPMLFLHILDRFCRTAHDGKPFPANSFRQLLFSGVSPALADCPVTRTPLAVYDPLETVNELIDVLEKIAESCVQRAVAFTNFRLAGPGVFQGRRNAGKWQTIFAYCGGWRTRSNGGRVKCGRSPLFIGQNASCDECGKLICDCDECRYCSKNCSQCALRQAKRPT
jgi:hypothetical protein